MPILDDIIDGDAPKAPPLHPRLVQWKQRIDAGEKPLLEVFRPSTASGLSQSEMSLFFAGGKKNGSREMESVPWDDELNAGLIELGVRAIDASHEADRFTLGLRAALRKLEREFGDGYFNAVLLELVKESGLTGDPQIADIVKHASALSPNRDGRGYGLCRDMTAAAISGRMYDLREKLHYVPEEARRILIAALARYLDERFSVTSRRQLGLL